jgi:hypothetical protein
LKIFLPWLLLWLTSSHGNLLVQVFRVIILGLILVLLVRWRQVLLHVKWNILRHVQRLKLLILEVCQLQYWTTSLVSLDWWILGVLLLWYYLSRSHSFILHSSFCGLILWRLIKWLPSFPKFIIFWILILACLLFYRYCITSSGIILRCSQLLHLAIVKALSHSGQILLFFLSALLIICILTGLLLLIGVNFLTCISRLLRSSEGIGTRRERLLLLKMVHVYVRCILLVRNSCRSGIGSERLKLFV